MLEAESTVGAQRCWAGDKWINDSYCEACSGGSNNKEEWQKTWFFKYDLEESTTQARPHGLALTLADKATSACAARAGGARGARQIVSSTELVHGAAQQGCRLNRKSESRNN